MNALKTAALSLGIYLSSHVAALAQNWWYQPPGRPGHGGGHTPTPASVPEIDASTALLACAALAAALAFVWERSRRRA